MAYRNARFAAGLLFLGICFAAAILSYRIGRERGYAAGLQPWLKEEVVTETVDVDDLLDPQPAARPIGGPTMPAIDELADMLKSIVEDSWDDVGGPGMITLAPPSKLVIKAPPSVQRQIAKVLEAARAGQRTMAVSSKHAVESDHAEQ